MYAINKISVLGHLQYKQLQPDNSEPQQRYNHSVLLTLCSDEIVDISPSKHNITVHGRVSRSPVSPFTQHSSALFSDGFLSTSVSSDFALADTFTAECWIKPRELSGETVLFDIGSSDRAGFLRINSNGVLYTSVNDNKTLEAKNTNIAVNTWSHVAVAADASGVRLYINGSKVCYSKTRASWPTEGKRLYIGADCGGGCNYNGYMSNLRIYKGTALYTAVFTPSSEPLAASIPIPSEA